MVYSVEGFAFHLLASYMRERLLGWRISKHPPMLIILYDVDILYVVGYFALDSLLRCANTVARALLQEL